MKDNISGDVVISITHRAPCVTDNGIHNLQHTVIKRWASHGPKYRGSSAKSSHTLEHSWAPTDSAESWGMIDGVPADADANTRRCAARLRYENTESMTSIHSWFHDAAISAHRFTLPVEDNGQQPVARNTRILTISVVLSADIAGDNRFINYYSIPEGLISGLFTTGHKIRTG